MLFSTEIEQLAYASRKAAAFVRTHDMDALACGRHELGDDDFVNVMEYATKDRTEACYESHVEYVDIQMVISGAEYMEIAPVEGLEVTSAYEVEGDYALYAGTHPGERFLMEPGRFCLVGPDDAHMPGVRVGAQAAHVKKAVFKIRVSHLEPTGIVE